MPRVKLVYQEHGEWADAKAQPWTCPHPRDRLRFDGSFAFPSYLYCRDCGARYLDRWHEVSDEERDRIVAEAKAQVAELVKAGII